jgi:hypothetical protein
MSEIVTTFVKIANVEQLTEMAGDLDGDMLKDALVGVYPFIANCVWTESVSEDGMSKEIVFSESYGTKGQSL